MHNYRLQRVYLSSQNLICTLPEKQLLLSGGPLLSGFNRKVQIKINVTSGGPLLSEFYVRYKSRRYY